MLILQTPMDFTDHQGASLGATDWVEITQDKLDAFAELTGDDHWIHVDTERAASEQPDGRTIAHGLFLLALAPRLQRQLFRIERRGAGLNYGYEKVRFTAPVPCGAFVRLRQEVIAAEPRDGGVRVELKSTFEIQGQDRPALVAHGILLIAGSG
ncbi:Acyl dehydratase [Mameliella alba]|uniref:MaoC family dehydratase n=1 Tax=Mameliella alba TaxID=561184 RepID=UPI000888B388|nr:MaoC family dehydratase [Mameliella alba]OWV45303.1 enoyl-CoA hydratase [Mameliella alba]PTR36773.1 acyl dehydratase [Mameliella alba]GGF77721.1 MaoC family dehydratase [Mameliella alba]SDD88439.1 Acyl dehydratase [Mameliella alba]